MTWILSGQVSEIFSVSKNKSISNGWGNFHDFPPWMSYACDIEHEFQNSFGNTECTVFKTISKPIANNREIGSFILKVIFN